MIIEHKWTGQRCWRVCCWCVGFRTKRVVCSDSSVDRIGHSFPGNVSSLLLTSLQCLDYTWPACLRTQAPKYVDMHLRKMCRLWIHKQVNGDTFIYFFLWSLAIIPIMYNISVPTSQKTLSISHKSQLFNVLRNMIADYFGKLYESRTCYPWLKMGGRG